MFFSDRHPAKTCSAILGKFLLCRVSSSSHLVPRPTATKPTPPTDAPRSVVLPLNYGVTSSPTRMDPSKVVLNPPPSRLRLSISCSNRARLTLVCWETRHTVSTLRYLRVNASTKASLRTTGAKLPNAIPVNNFLSKCFVFAHL